MKKNILLWPCIGLIVLTVLSGLIMERNLEGWFVKHTHNELSSVTSSLKVMLERYPHSSQIAELDLIADQTHLLKPDIRITLIDAEGKVLGDSNLSTSEIAQLENHANRTEFKEAIQSGIGKATRYSNTLNEDLIYHAEFYHDEFFKGVIRTSTSSKLVSEALNDMHLVMAYILFGMILLLALLIYTAQRMVNQHVEESKEELEKNVADRTREIELLHRLANMLAACNTMEEAQQVVEDIVPRLLGPINGAISLIRSSRNQLEIKLDWGGKWPGEISYSPDECWGLRKGKYHLANDEHTSLPCKHMSKVGQDQTLCIPLIAHGNTIGILHLYLGDQNFSSAQQHLAFTIGEHLGLALANLNLQDKLREQAIRDPLTGLYNRRFLEESLEHEIMRAQRRNHCLSVLMLDMDHFKRFNDTFGHDAGDFVLKSLGTALTESVRGEDIVCRVGGEELAIILPESGPESAGMVASKLCEVVRNLHLNFHGQSLGQLTISIGIACYPQQGDTGEILMKAADVALYDAKQAGRDRFCHSESQVENMMSNTQSLVEQIMEGSKEPTEENSTQTTAQKSD